jgi:pimeloyl-ACP methyl ester carboxylesterase
VLRTSQFYRQLVSCVRTPLSAFAAFAIAGCHPVCCDTCTIEPGTQAFSVSVEHGTRRTTAGDQVAYSLFMPQPSESSAAPPYPAVVISHGLARSKRFHADTACALAERGIVVLTPDRISLLGGEEAQLRNVENLVDHLRWLRSRTVNEDDPLFGQLDSERVGLVGHSAGGAVSLEAAVELDEAGEGVHALMLLDAVPWTRTVERAGELHELLFASVRSEPTACNAEGAIRDVLARLPFATEDILVVGGSHCDPENPTDLLCKLACGGSDERARAAYQELVCAFLGEALSVPDVEASPGFPATVDRLVTAGRVATSPIGERSPACHSLGSDDTL